MKRIPTKSNESLLISPGLKNSSILKKKSSIESVSMLGKPMTFGMKSRKKTSVIRETDINE